MGSLISISVKDALSEIERAKNRFGDKKVNNAIRMALNDGVRRSKTDVKKGIQQLYNIKPSRIFDANPKKGLSILFASNDNLQAELRAGHTPINLSETKVDTKFTTAYLKDGSKARLSGKNGKQGKVSKRSIALVSVEVFKGDLKTLSSAFIPGVATSRNGNQFATPAIFARGKRGNPDFKFSTDNKRYPIDTLGTVSIHTAALNAKTQGLYVSDVNEYTIQRLIRNLNRLNET